MDLKAFVLIWSQLPHIPFTNLKPIINISYRLQASPYPKILRPTSLTTPPADIPTITIIPSPPSSPSPLPSPSPSLPLLREIPTSSLPYLPPMTSEDSEQLVKQYMEIVSQFFMHKRQIQIQT